jgi:hypothetical protein
VPDVTPGGEHEFRRLGASFAISDWVDRLVESGEGADDRRRRPAPASIRPATVAGPRPAPRGLRARFAARLARLALTLHPQAAADVVLVRAEDSR